MALQTIWQSLRTDVIMIKTKLMDRQQYLQLADVLRDNFGAEGRKIIQTAGEDVVNNAFITGCHSLLRRASCFLTIRLLHTLHCSLTRTRRLRVKK